MRNGGVKNFTVVLRYPDYMSDTGELYVGHIRAHSPVDAILVARTVALMANPECDDKYDFKAELVFPGHHWDLNPER